MIIESDINEVLSRVNITDVYGTDLKRAGNGKYKCCCPFHTEKSPSFTVWDDGRYHCFGCGAHGNAASFIAQKEGMNYYEAIRMLAKRYHYTLHEETQTRTPEAIEKDKRRELMNLVYDKVQRHFVANLYLDNPESKAALEYATNRWGAEYVRDYGIGYAMNSYNDLLTYAEKEQMPKDILLELGLLKKSEKKGNLYDFFRCRIMIPIRSVSHLTIGYTARIVESIYDQEEHKQEEEPAKYFNSPTSLLYSKDKSVFGLDVARSQASKEDLFYLVEGGPDVLRLQSIGVLNAVASLGGNWTENQLNLLHTYAHKLCLIPDIDKVPTGKAWGVGIDKVIATGEQALKLGFDAITIIAIPSKGKNDKVDADEFFKDKSIFKTQTPVDYFEWYAQLLEDSNPNAQLEHLEIIAKLLSYIKDEYRQSFLLNKLKDIIPSTTIATWRTAINKERRARTQAQLKKDSQKSYLDTDLLDQFGFNESGNHYISVGNDGRTRLWSNFVLHPLFHVKDAIASSRLFTIINEDGISEVIELKTEDMVSLSKFRTKIESLGNYVWLAKEDQLIRLKQYLFKVTETAQLITQLGWQRQWGFYAFGNGIFYGDSWYETDSYGVVRLDENTKEQQNYYLPSSSKLYAQDPTIFQFERKFVNKSFGDFSLNEYVSRLVAAFGDNGKVGFAFLLAAIFRDIIVRNTKMFPILNIFGPKGSGKSELGHSLMAFFIIDNIPPNIKNSTMAALADAVAQCANALVHIDEYKNNLDTDKIEFLKGLWDGAGRNRMNMDRDKRREVSQVDTAVILTGQEMTSQDNALFSRVIYLTTDTGSASRTVAERERFQSLVDLRKLGCSHLTVQLLKYRRQFEANFRDSWNIVADDLRAQTIDTIIEERIFNNWLVPLAAFHALRNMEIKLPFDYAELLKVCNRLIRVQNEQVRDNDEVAIFWNMVAILRQNGNINLDYDYRIERREAFRIQGEKKGDKSKTIYLNPPRRILFLRHRRVFDEYAKHGRDIGQSILNPTSMKYYIESSRNFFYGISTTIRFKETPKVLNSMEQKTGVNGYSYVEPIQITDQAYCIDYDVIEELYGINLDVACSSPEEAPIPQQPEPPQPKDPTLFEKEKDESDEEKPNHYTDV